MIDSDRLTGVPQNIIAGDFSTDDFHGPDFDTVTVLWDRGEHPDADEIRYMIQNQLGQYGREAAVRNRVRKMAAGSEDTEPVGSNVGFLAEPKKSLYPPLFPDGDKIPPDVVQKLKDHALDALAESFDNPDAFVYFTIYGSGISYNWDEGGDLDLQMWVDYEKFADQNEKKITSDDLLAECRRLIGPINFPNFSTIGIPVPPDPKEPCDGTMMIQYYAKLGTGSKDENLASQPYACYDLETDKWLVHPKPMRPTFYGDAFLTLMPKAEDMAMQAESLLAEYNRNVLNWQFWFSLYSRHKRPEYHKEYLEAQRNAILEKQSIKTMFDAVFGGRAEAYAPGGKGIYDERDIMQKLLEVWGIFQDLKHYSREPLPWDEQELPTAPAPEKSKGSADVAQDDQRNGSKKVATPHTWTIASKSGWVKETSPNDSPEHIDPGGWAGIMQKAQRLREEGNVTVQRNGVQNIVGTVVGDHGTYNTEIWRSDPQRNTISLWNCTCPWGEFSWGRTRQFKKFEGRPCAHTLALYWQALTQPLDEEYGQNQQLQIPGLDPYSVDLNQAVQQTVPQRQPSQIVQPPTPTSWQQEQLTFPGTFSKWHKAGALVNGDYARINKQMIGYDDRGTQYTVPRNSIVEVIWSDDNETIAIYSLNSPALGPHNVRITDETSNFSWVPRTRGTAPRRHR